MSKFKKGDWLFEDDFQPGDTPETSGYYVHDVLPEGKYVLSVHEGEYGVYSESYLSGCTVEPRCTGWDWVVPEPVKTFGLKVGDTVTIGSHDKRSHYLNGKSFMITGIDETYSDGVARFKLDGDRGSNWHPFWLGVCDGNGNPLPPKPETVKLYEYLVQSAQGGWHLEIHPVKGQSYTQSPGVPFRMVPTGRTFEIPKEEKP